MTTIAIGFVAVSSFSAFASSSDQSIANSLYKTFAEDVISAVSLRDAALNALPNELLAAESSNKLMYCNTGYYGKQVSVGIPFGIGQNNSCIKAYKEIATSLEGIVESPAFKYLKEVVELSNEASVTIEKISELNINLKKNSCNDRHINFLNEIKNEEYLWNLSVHDKKSKIKMNTAQAVNFIKLNTENGKDLVSYIENAENKKEKIQRGLEISLALKVLRFSINNNLVLEPLMLSRSRSMIKGCELLNIE